MADATHAMGADLALGPTGDLALVSGDSETTQRLLRRLLTPVGGYIEHMDYGAGLPGMVGEPSRDDAIRNAVLAQVSLEDAIALLPEPVVTITDQNDGRVFCHIAYVSELTGEQKSAVLTLGA